jgi:hypothetical protein
MFRDNNILCYAARNNIYYFIFKRNKTIKRTPLERNFCD